MPDARYLLRAATASVRAMRSAFAFFLLALVAATTSPALAQGLDPLLLEGLKARAIGPAGMSGRVAAIDAVAGRPEVVVVGTASGGVWKSVNGGLTWDSIFDDATEHAIGAVAIDQKNPDVIWVGTGEGNPRNSVSLGGGVFRSLDGGRTWAKLGLEATERIHRILLHPDDPDTAYVAAMGRLWGENPERGVYKTTDGGKSWTRVLHVDERTGAGELIMDPTNPNKLFAAMWQFRRHPWIFTSGGPGSGLYRSVDGGASWTKLTPADGLPAGELGRMGLAIAPTDPRLVYALVEAKDNVLLQSTDGGFSFKAVNKDTNVNPRPFYYADIRVDPQRPDRVYRLATLTEVSDDGGKTFRTLIPGNKIHVDHHALWISPDGRTMYNGNDGGVSVSLDRGETWRFVRNLPIAQFYHVRVDNERPYNVYGGMQDNGTWRGPAEVWENGGIRNHHWEEIGFGDGFDAAPDPEDALRGYAMSQEGFLVRWDLRTGVRKSLRPAHPDPGVTLRFNWNAPLAQDPFDPATIYYGSQFVHRSTDRGDSWQIVSGDLTTNNPAYQDRRSGGLTPDVSSAENHTTLVAISPSSKQRGVIWTGSDDGRVHVTRDGGTSWQSVEGGIGTVPAGTWVPMIEASPHDPAVAFVVFDNHRRGDATPYVFRADNYGAGWTELSTAGVRGYAHVIKQDPVDPDLLFLGTEYGLYVSVDGGRHWTPFQLGLPKVLSVMDLAIQEREVDLVLGTHGRSAYVIDGYQPLRDMTPGDLTARLKLFDIPDAQQYWVKQTKESRFPGDEEFRGRNQAYGAAITWVTAGADLPHPDDDTERQRLAAPDAKPSDKPKVKIEIRDAAGALVRTMEVETKQGLNRTAWDLRRDGLRQFADDRSDDLFGGGPRGPEVTPGAYSVTVKFDGQEQTRTVTVLADPRYPVAAEVWAGREAATKRLLGLQDRMVEAGDRILAARADADRLIAKAKERQAAEKRARGGADAPADDPVAALIKAAETYKTELAKVEDELRTHSRTKGIVARDRTVNQIQLALGFIGSSWDPVTSAQTLYIEAAARDLGTVLDALAAVETAHRPPLAEKAAGLKLDLLEPREALVLP